MIVLGSIGTTTGRRRDRCGVDVVADRGRLVVRRFRGALRSADAVPPDPAAIVAAVRFAIRSTIPGGRQKAFGWAGGETGLSVAACGRALARAVVARTAAGGRRERAEVTPGARSRDDRGPDPLRGPDVGGRDVGLVDVVAVARAVDAADPGGAELRHRAGRPTGGPAPTGDPITGRRP